MCTKKDVQELCFMLRKYISIEMLKSMFSQETVYIKIHVCEQSKSKIKIVKMVQLIVEQRIFIVETYLQERSAETVRRILIADDFSSELKSHF